MTAENIYDLWMVAFDDEAAADDAYTAFLESEIKAKCDAATQH